MLKWSQMQRPQRSAVRPIILACVSVSVEFRWAAAAVMATRISPTAVSRSTRYLRYCERPDEERWREREARGDEDSVDAVEIKIDGAPEGQVLSAAPAPAAGGWLPSIAGAKRPAAREARGAPEAKTGEAPAGPDAGARSSD